MKKLVLLSPFFLFVAFILAGLLPGRSADEAEKKEWTFTKADDSWTGGPLSHSTWPVHDGAMWIKAAGAEMPAAAAVAELALPGKKVNVLQISMTVPKATKCRLSFQTDLSPVDGPEKTIDFALHPGATPQTYSLDLQSLSTWKDTIVGLRLEFPDAAADEEIAIQSVKALDGVTISTPLDYVTYTPEEKPLAKEFRLASLFNNGMVLQRQLPIQVWGHAGEGQTVTVEFEGQKQTSPVTSGHWQVTFPAHEAGGPYELKAGNGTETITYSDVMVGDVWLCAGQSNMGPTPSGNPPPPELQKELILTDYPNLRVVAVPHLNSDQPMANNTIESSFRWKKTTKTTVRSFSAIAYYFGQQVHVNEKVPVGLLMVVKAGSQIEQWMGADTLASLFSPDEISKLCPARHMVGGIYNGNIFPSAPFGIKGVVWYQGESNGLTPPMYLGYYKTLPGMIQEWRKLWGIGDFPVLLVQLPRFSGHYPAESWAYLREAQLECAKQLPNVGLDVTFDTGDPGNLHPKNKYVAGTRLGLLGRGFVYGEKMEYCGPLYREMKTNGNQVLVSFDHAGTGLKAQGDLVGFQVSDDKKTWTDAKAEITGKDQITITGAGGSSPAAVRYGWSNVPTACLFNNEGFPASPFTSDPVPLTLK